MIGLINNSYLEFLSIKFGQDVVEKILDMAGLPPDTLNTGFVSSCPYADDILLNGVMGAATELLKLDRDALNVEYGRYWITSHRSSAYQKLLGCLGGTFVDFMRSLNSLHLHISLGLPGFLAPEFLVEDVTSTSLTLHYYSLRPGLHAWVEGMVVELAKVFFGLEVDMQLIRGRNCDRSCDHEVYSIRFPAVTLQKSDVQTKLQAYDSQVGLAPETFYHLFPFHFVMDMDLRLIQAGSALARLVPELSSPGCVVSDHLQILHPRVPWDLEHQLQFQWSSKLIISTSKGLELTGGLYKIPHVNRGADGRLQEGKDVVLFLGSPRISNLDELKRHDLSISDFPTHDMAAEFVLLAEQRQVEHDLKEQYEVKTLDLQAVTGQLQQERWRAEQDNIMLKQTLVKTLQTHDTAVGRPSLGTDTPADMTLKLLDKIIVGEAVDMHQVLHVRHTLLNSGTNLWQPRAMNAHALGKALGRPGDDEVMRALEQLLVARHQDDDDAWSLSSVTEGSESLGHALPVESGVMCESSASNAGLTGRGRARLSIGSVAHDLLPLPSMPWSKGHRSVDSTCPAHGAGTAADTTAGGPASGAQQSSGSAAPTDAASTSGTAAVDAKVKGGRTSSRRSSTRSSARSGRHSAPTVNAQLLMLSTQVSVHQTSGFGGTSSRRASLPERVPPACPYAGAYKPYTSSASGAADRSRLAAIESAEEVSASTALAVVALQDAMRHNSGAPTGTAPLSGPLPSVAGLGAAAAGAETSTDDGALRSSRSLSGGHGLTPAASASVPVAVPAVVRDTSPNTPSVPAPACPLEKERSSASATATAGSSVPPVAPPSSAAPRKQRRSGLLRHFSARFACASPAEEPGASAQEDGSTPAWSHQQQQPQQPQPFFSKLKTFIRRASSSLSQHKASGPPEAQAPEHQQVATPPPPQPASLVRAATRELSPRSMPSVDQSSRALPLSTVPSLLVAEGQALGPSLSAPSRQGLEPEGFSYSPARTTSTTSTRGHPRTKTGIIRLLDRSHSAHSPRAPRPGVSGAHAWRSKGSMLMAGTRSVASNSSGASTPAGVVVTATGMGQPSGARVPSLSLGLLLGSSQPERTCDTLVLSRASLDLLPAPHRHRCEEEGMHMAPLSPLGSSGTRRPQVPLGSLGLRTQPLLATTSVDASPGPRQPGTYDAAVAVSVSEQSAERSANADLSPPGRRRGSVSLDISTWARPSVPQMLSPAAAAARLTQASSGTAAAAMDAKESATNLLLQIINNPTDQLTAALRGVEEWQYDSFSLDAATGGRPLSCLGYYLLRQSGLIKRFHLHEIKLVRFLMRIEDGYPQHPYHCRIHAADVLRSLHVLLTVGGVLSSLSSRSSSSRAQPDGADKHDKHEGTQVDVVWRTRLLACYLAAICHDYEHRGVNNDFLIRSGDSLALLYNDHSPMENHHVAAAFTLMKDRQYAFMHEVSKKVHDVVRKDVVELVLSTDMKQHFSLTGIFSAKLAAALGSAPQGPSASSSGELRTSTELVWDDEMQMLALKVALKAADLGHLTSKPEVHKLWVSRLEEEMFRQGDRERALGQPVSALMDRRKEGVTRSQSGFFNIVAIPMYKALAQAFPGTNPMLQNALANLNMWLEKEAAATSAAANGVAAPQDDT